MNGQELERLFIVLARIADALDAVVKKIEIIDGHVESCNEDLISVSKNTW